MAVRIEDEFDYLFKISLIGDTGVGKTSVIRRVDDDTYQEFHKVTIGTDFTVKTIDLDRKRVKIWDTAGAERFRSLTQNVYRNANGIILVYDITKRSSFDNISLWLNDINKYCWENVFKLLVERERIVSRDWYEEPSHQKLIFFYLEFKCEAWVFFSHLNSLKKGNKSDLHSQRVIGINEARRFAELHGISGVIETSAKNGTNITEALVTMAEGLKGQIGGDFSSLESDPDVVNLHTEEEKYWNCCSTSYFYGSS